MVKFKTSLKTGDIFYKILRTVFLIGICYLFLFPILYSVSLAIRHPNTVNDPSIIWIPKSISFESIKMALKLMHYGESLLLTFVMTFFSTIGTVLSCALVGYGLSRFKFKTKPFLWAIVILMIVLPPQLLTIPQFLNYRYFDFGGLLKILAPVTGIESINLTNGNVSVLTFIIPSFFASGLKSGLFIFIFRQFFSGMHREIEEAARVDGCNALGIFIKMALPLSIPAVTTVTLFSVVWHWNEYYSSTIYFLGDVKPISVMLKNLSSLLLSDNSALIMQSADLLRTYIAAGTLLTILPLLIFYVFTQRYFVESIESTGLVG